MKREMVNIFELTGMPPDGDPEAQNKVIDDSIQDMGWIHLHFSEEDYGERRYFLIQRKVYDPVGCDSIRLLDPCDVDDDDLIAGIMEAVEDIDSAENYTDEVLH